jgi:hypothetical protein
MSQTISNSLPDAQLNTRNTAGGGVLSTIAQLQEIGCDVDVSINGETRVIITRDNIRYTVREYGSSSRPSQYAIGAEFNGSMDLQSRQSAYASVEDALHTIFRCITNDPRQDGIEIRGISYTDVR